MASQLIPTPEEIQRLLSDAAAHAEFDNELGIKVNIGMHHVQSFGRHHSIGNCYAASYPVVRISEVEMIEQLIEVSRPVTFQHGRIVTAPDLDPVVQFNFLNEVDEVPVSERTGLVQSQTGKRYMVEVFPAKYFEFRGV